MPFEFRRTLFRMAMDEMSRAIEQIQFWLERNTLTLNEEAWRDNRLIEGVELTGGLLNKVEHGLDRVIRGYLVTRQNKLVTIRWPENVNSERTFPDLTDAITEDVDLTVFLPLVPSGSVTVDLVVF